LVKKFGKSSETPVLGSKTGVSKHSEFTENSEFVLFKTLKNYKKMTLKSNFGNCEKLVLTQKPTQMFGLKFGMQGLIAEVLLLSFPDRGSSYKSL